MRIYTLNELTFMVAIIVLVLDGCAMTSTITFSHVHQPVLVGSVEKIGGGAAYHQHIKKRIDLETISFSYEKNAPTKLGEYLVQKKDTELLRFVDSPGDKISVDRVAFRTGHVSGIWMVMLPVPYILVDSTIRLTGSVFEADGRGDAAR